MLVSIDDSGDPGFKKIGRGSPRHFVIACVIFEDELEAEKTAVAIKQLKRDLKFSDSTEFKFNGSRSEVRLKVLKITLPFAYKIRAIVIDKEKITSEELRNTGDSFYNYAIKSVLRHNFGTLKKAKIRMDGHGDRRFRRNLTNYLRRELNSPTNRVMDNLRLVDSKSNVLIQMADMIAGAIRRSYEQEKSDCFIYREIIKKKIQDCWEFK